MYKIESNLVLMYLALNNFDKRAKFYKHEHNTRGSHIKISLIVCNDVSVASMQTSISNIRAVLCRSAV